MKLKTIALSLSCVIAAGMFAGCGAEYAPEEDPTISYLYVDTYQGGFGSEFLNVVGRAFETANAGKSYADGKTGVKIVVGETQNNNGSTFKSNVKNATSDVHVVEGLYYTDLLQDNSILDVSSIVTASLSDGKTIESKLNTQQKEVLKYNGKYYSIPTFAGYSGLSYNKKLFTDNNLYFSNSIEPSTEISSYTGATYTGRPLVESKFEQKSPGPDGVSGTEDDGLPSSYEEFFYLFDAMLDCSPAIIPLITYPGHYTNYIFQELLCAASTSNGLNAMFTFDSNGEAIDVINGWVDNVTPSTSKTVITTDNGYLSTMELAKYQALKFIKHLATYSRGGKAYIHEQSWTSALTNTTAQKLFLESTLRSNVSPIATINEGVYWYNESAGARQSIVSTYGDQAKNMDLGYMTLPAKETGTVTVGNGKTQLVADTLNYYLVVNANVANKPEKLALAQDFVKFMYSDNMLQEMTVASGIPFALKYDLTTTQYNSLDKLPQSFWNIYKAAKDDDAYITAMSTSKIFVNNILKFSFKTTNNFFKSRVGGAETTDPFLYFHSYPETNAKDYFTGMSITQSGWSEYNK